MALPNNGEEAAYLAFAIVGELADFLIKKSLLSRTDFDLILEKVSVRLSQGNSGAAQRAAQFIADRKKGEI